MSWKPQTADIAHALLDLTPFGRELDAGRFDGLERDLALAVLEEAGRFAAAEIAPLNRDGDIHGCTYDPASRAVTTPPGWKAAYDAFVRAGWASAPGDAEHGGQGMPLALSLALQELWNTASMAWGLGPLLTQGACETISRFAAPELKARYLPKMISGEWTGAMCLTEPQAGSDLSAIRTRAIPRPDGGFAIEGEKIFISYGEHDLTDNIIHLVLARLPDAPAGTRGLSLFLVPKVSPEGAANALYAAGLEHKMGIHGSPTITLIFEGASGWLVGEANRGLHHMFTMMNHARLHIGIQGVAVAERAFQKARAFALERRQGRRAGRDGPVPIVEHPDVRRMLLDAQVKIMAARAICYDTAFNMDMSRLAGDEQTRQRAAARAALLTPLAKAFGTDVGVEVADAAIQVHGGMGYMEETGAAQLLRDARIAPIYEGTNGIQALDLVLRKITLDGGLALQRLLDETAATVTALKEAGPLADLGERLAWALRAAGEATRFMTAGLEARDERPLAAAVPYLRLLSLLAGAAALSRSALITGSGRRAFLARHFAGSVLPETAGLKQRIMNSGGIAAPEALEVLRAEEA